MKCPKSEEFSGTVNGSHLGVELAPLKIAYAEARFAVRGADGPAARSAAFRKKIPFYPIYNLKG